MSAKSLALFISDLHLSVHTPKTAQVFFDFLEKQAKNTERLYILGDLFEYWAGDDDMGSPFNHQVVSALSLLVQSGTQVFWLCGNRDFLVDKKFVKETKVTPLEDLHIETFSNLKVAMCHGDTLCLEDEDYLKFRAMVRKPLWKRTFLFLPLWKRKEIIEGFRKKSHEDNKKKERKLFDVTPSAIDDLFQKNSVSVLIHGHTHRPAIHEHGSNKRYVLSDWQFDEEPSRGNWIEITQEGQIVVHSFL